jgi:hypothetical protein
MAETAKHSQALPDRTIPVLSLQYRGTLDSEETLNCSSAQIARSERTIHTLFRESHVQRNVCVDSAQLVPGH